MLSAVKWPTPPASPLLSLSFKCRQHGCLAFYLFICWLSFFLSQTHTLCAPILSFSLCPPECLSVPTSSFIPDLRFLTAPLTNWNFRTFPIIGIFQSKTPCAETLRLHVSMFSCCAALLCLCSGETVSPVRHRCFLVTGQTRRLHRGPRSSRAMAPPLSILLN